MMSEKANSITVSQLGRLWPVYLVMAAVVSAGMWLARLEAKTDTKAEIVDVIVIKKDVELLSKNVAEIKKEQIVQRRATEEIQRGVLRLLERDGKRRRGGGP